MSTPPTQTVAALPALARAKQALRALGDRYLLEPSRELPTVASDAMDILERLLGDLLFEHGKALPGTLSVQQAYSSLRLEWFNLLQQWIPYRKPPITLPNARSGRNGAVVYRALRDAPYGFAEQFLWDCGLVEVAHYIRIEKRKFRDRLRRHARKTIELFLRRERIFPRNVVLVSGRGHVSAAATLTAPAVSLAPPVADSTLTAVLAALQGHDLENASNKELLDAYCELYPSQSRSSIVSDIAGAAKRTERTIWAWAARVPGKRRASRADPTDRAIRDVILPPLRDLLQSQKKTLP